MPTAVAAYGMVVVMSYVRSRVSLLLAGGCVLAATAIGTSIAPQSVAVAATGSSPAAVSAPAPGVAVPDDPAVEAVRIQKDKPAVAAVDAIRLRYPKDYAGGHVGAALEVAFKGRAPAGALEIVKRSGVAFKVLENVGVTADEMDNAIFDTVQAARVVGGVDGYLAHRAEGSWSTIEVLGPSSANSLKSAGVSAAATVDTPSFAAKVQGRLTLPASVALRFSDTAPAGVKNGN